MFLTRKERGDRSEEQARRHLEGKGLRLRGRNYRCRQGEIDLIMEEGETLVFVEVRYRANARFGSAAESVTGQKQQRVLAAVAHYLHCNPTLANRPCRCDVVALEGETAEIEWIRNAFV